MSEVSKKSYVFKPYISLLLFNIILPINYEILLGININAILTLVGCFLILTNPLSKNKTIYQIIFLLIVFYIFKEFKRYYFYQEELNFFPVIRITVFMLSFTLAKTFEDIKWAFHLLIKLVFVSMIWGFGIFIFGEPFATITKVYSFANENWIGTLKAGARMVGFIGDIVLYSYQLCLLTIFFWIKFRKNHKISNLLLLLIASIAIVINAERALVLAVIAGVVMYEGIGVRNIFKALISLVVIGVIMYGANHLIISKTNFEESALERLTEKDDKLVDRFLKQYAAFKTIIDNPLSGGTFNEYSVTYYRLTKNEANSAHNYYLNIARDIGIIAWFILFFLINKLLAHYKILKKYLRNTEEFKFIHQIYLYIIAISIIGLAHNAGLFYSEVAIYSLFGILIGTMSIPYDIRRVNH
jgi:hypothetical protein